MREGKKKYYKGKKEKRKNKEKMYTGLSQQVRKYYFTKINQLQNNILKNNY